MVIPVNTDRIAEQLVYSIYEAATKAEDKPRNYLGMSEIGGHCDRALWYSFNKYEYEPLDGRVLMLFHLGDLIEQELIRLLQSAGYRITDTQLAFSDFDNKFSGHCDGIIHGVTKEPHIFEAKSANKRRFETIKKKGVRAVAPEYYCQCQCYMGYAKLNRAIIVVYCKDTSEVYAERFDFNQADFDALRLRAKNIIEAQAAPERDISDRCKWCRYKNICDCWMK